MNIPQYLSSRYLTSTPMVLRIKEISGCEGAEKERRFPRRDRSIAEYCGIEVKGRPERKTPSSSRYSNWSRNTVCTSRRSSRNGGGRGEHNNGSRNGASGVSFLRVVKNERN